MFNKGPGSPSQRKGLQYEKLALNYLLKRGLRKQCTNYHCRFGEIDLILLDEQTLVFAEVRFRSREELGLAAETVDWRKQQKLIKCAQCYLLQHDIFDKCDARFDILSVSESQGTTSIHWLKNAFILS